MGAIQGRKGDIYLQTGNATAFTGEACHLVSGTTYQISNAAKLNWDRATAVTVYVGGNPVSSGFTVQYPAGRIVFDADPGDAVTVSGKCYATTKVGYVQNYDISIESAALETTSLGDEARTYMGLGLLAWSAAFERLYENDTWAALARANATSGYRLLCKFYEDRSGPKRLVWVGYVTVTGHSTNLSLEELVRENITLQGEELIYYIDETEAA